MNDHPIEDGFVLRALDAVWWTALLAVLLPSFLVHRDVWDGVIGAYGLERGDLSGIYQWLVPSNWGLIYLMLKGVLALATLTAIPALFWIKLIIAGSVIGLAHETRLLCSRMLGWREIDSRFAGLLTLTFPCWYLLYGSTFVYLVFIWAVFVGDRWMHEGRNRFCRMGGFVVILLSFQVNSNFVMICALEAVRGLYRDKETGWHWIRPAAVVGTAVTIYLSLRLIWPPNGSYAGYNNLVWPFSAKGRVAWARAMLMAVTWLPWVAAPAGAAWLIGRRTEVSGRVRLDGREAAAVALLVGGALFAYMAVGKGAPLFVIDIPLHWLGTGTHLGKPSATWLYTTADGWSMRNAFLLSVSGAIAATWLLRVVTSPGPRRTLAWRAACALAFVVNGAFLVNGHAAKQLRMAQEAAIIRGLEGHRPFPSGTIDVEITPGVGWSVWTYEANYWFWTAYRRSAWAVAAFTDEPSDRARALTERDDAMVSSLPRVHFLMDQADLPGCHSSIQVQLPEGLSATSFAADTFGIARIPPATVVERAVECPLR
jgi:hypothetical protein